LNWVGTSREKATFHDPFDPAITMLVGTDWNPFPA
jgi:hypothetical protein